MNIFTDLVFYKENQISIRSKISYYRKLGISSLIIPSPGKITEESIDDLFHISNLFWQADIIVFVEVDPIEASKDLLGTDIIDWKDPKIRSGFYKFISFISKYGIRGIYFKNLEKLWEYSGNSYQVFDSYIRELAKNTIKGSQTLGIGEINSRDENLLVSFRKASINNLDAVCINSYGFDLDYLKNQIIQGDESILEMNWDLKSLLGLLNFENYPYHCQSLLTSINFFSKSLPVITSGEEFGIPRDKQNSNDFEMIKASSKMHKYYQKLIQMRNSSLALSKGSIREIAIKDSDVIAFTRFYNGEKIIVFGNMSQREVLCDIRFHFIDLYDYKYLLGNYGKRRIVKNLLLRPYEFVAFRK